MAGRTKPSEARSAANLNLATRNYGAKALFLQTKYAHCEQWRL